MKNYLLCYDIADPKRLYRVRKHSYPLALGGQKSALFVPATKSEIQRTLKTLTKEMKLDEDRVNIIEVEEHPLILGRSMDIIYDEGAIII
jgi:CRISPR/Cas system-associated endoribonuclease Cas2